MSELDDIKVIVNVELKGLETDTIEVISDLFEQELAQPLTLSRNRELSEAKKNFRKSIKLMPDSLETIEDTITSINVQPVFDGNGECETCMIEEDVLEELKELESEVKTFPEYYYKTDIDLLGEKINIRKRIEKGSNIIIRDVSTENLAEQIVDLLNNGSIKVED
ncbi:hypothetical protein SDC9_07466 [bioreactor metagenome]|uniref:Uncharacterized protein n=1 Tax=bioreactor metagenome TaxID=1076179 RepID=A0A644T5T8_9ZZZZ|nr:hypothetical protein [Methanobrevibacter sp.]MEA4956922.1 hypothetical protein [Methanobrevibacter sp.]